MLATGTDVQLVHTRSSPWPLALVWLVGMTNAFNLLDNMDGLAATLAAIAFGFFAIDAVTVHPNDTVLVLALAGALRLLRLPAVQPAPARQGARLHGRLGLAGARLRAGRARARRRAGASPERPSRRSCCRSSSSRCPILDTTLVTIVRLLEGRPIYQGGRDHTSHRLVRFGLSERHAVLLLALIATALGGTSLAYNVLDNQRWRSSASSSRSCCSSSSRASSPTSSAALAGGEDAARCRRFAVHWRRLVEVVVDFVLITGAFVAAYLVRFGWPGTTNQRHIAELTLPILIAARYLAFIPFGLYRSVWRYAGAATCSRSHRAVVVSEVVAARLHGADHGHAATSHARSSSSTR